MFSFPRESISGINLNIHPQYVSKKMHFYYKSEVCSCTQVGNYYMIYINQSYIKNQTNQLSGVLNLLLSLTCLGLLDFGQYFKYNQDSLYIYLLNNLDSIIQLSEISFAWDYLEQDITKPVPILSKLETSLLRHQSLWCVYDKRVYYSQSYRNYRNNMALMDHPIRMELHLNLKYASRYLNICVLNQTEAEIFNTFGPYIWKSWKRNNNGLLPFLPISYIQSGKIHHSLLPSIKAA